MAIGNEAPPDAAGDWLMSEMLALINDWDQAPCTLVGVRCADSGCEWRCGGSCGLSERTERVNRMVGFHG